MEHLKRKLIIGIILLLALTGLFGAFFQIFNAKRMIIHRMETRASMTKVMSQCLETDLQLSMNVGSAVKESIENRVRLGSAACKKIMEADWDGKPMFFMGGAVIVVTEKGIQYPKRFPAGVIVSADQFTEEMGMTYTRSPDDENRSDPFYVVYYCRVNDSAYYIEWEKRENFDKRQDELYVSGMSFAGLERAFNIDLLIIDTAEKETGEHPLLYKSENLPESTTAEALGITDQMLSSAVGSSIELTGKLFAETDQTLVIGGQLYEVFLKEIDNAVIPDATAAYLSPFQNTRAQVKQQIEMILAIFVAVAIVFLVWLYSVLLLVRKSGLTERQREEYSSKSCWQRILGFLGVASAVILLVFALMFSLFRLFSIYQQVDTSILTLQKRIEDNSDRPRIAEDKKKKIYEDYAAKTAELLTEYPDLFDTDDLQTFCDIIGADYIMLFDSNGDEVLTNSDFVDLSLGTDPSSTTVEFRLLLNGVPSITHDLMTDEQTKLSNFIFGARVGKPGKGDRYGAMLMAVPKDRIVFGGVGVAEDVMVSLVSDGMLAFSVDPESGTILYASDPTLTGNSAVNLGLPEEALHGEFQDFFKLDGLPYFGKSGEIGDTICLYAADSSNIYSHVATTSMISGLISFCFLLILALYMMYGYRKNFEKYASAEPSPENSSTEKRSLVGIQKYLKDLATKLGVNRGAYVPRGNAVIAAQILLILGVAWIGVKFLSDQTGASKSLISFIVSGQWAKGFNLFAVTGIFILLAEVIVAVMVLRIFIRLLGAALGRMGTTVCRLLLKILTYVGIIVFVYFALYDLGLSPGTLLASLGMLSFAISLGGKDLITDVLAGFSIVFDREYENGDIIEVGGYRGEVLEIGVRSTKLEGSGGNIKIIGNRDVKDIVNLTRKNSWYLMEISISDDQSLDSIEAMLNEQLPRIGQSIPEIISGPYYKGVISFGHGSITLSIITECKEKNYLLVQRSVNRAILDLFTREGIKIL